MKAPPDGGPAFPTTAVSFDRYSVRTEPSAGMALRDWLAGQALGGMLATETEKSVYRTDVVAERAYEIADAMIAARLPKKDA